MLLFTAYELLQNSQAIPFIVEIVFNSFVMFSIRDKNLNFFKAFIRCKQNILFAGILTPLSSIYKAFRSYCAMIMHYFILKKGHCMIHMNSLQFSV